MHAAPLGQNGLMTSHVLVLGEALVDLIVTEEAAVPHIGGGPLNTARALARLGVPTAFVGGVSTDVFGKRITAAMLADGVRIDTVVKTEAPTTMALVELNAAGAASYRFYFEGTSVAACTPERANSAIDALLASDEDVCAVHVGTLGLVIEPAASASEAIVNRFAGSALIMIDPNIRQVVLGEIRDAYLARLFRVLPKADVVKVSDEDLAWIMPGVDLVEAAKSLVAKGSGAVLITRGGDGITVVCSEGVVDVPAPKAEVVDTVGAGDTFAAGVLSWWFDHEQPSLLMLANLVAATVRGAAAAAIVVARAGANPPTRAELGL